MRVVAVRTLPKEGHLLGDPDHGIGLAFDVEELADRISGAEKLPCPGRAEDHDRGRGVHVVGRDVASAAHVELAHLLELGLDGRDPEILLCRTRPHRMSTIDFGHHQIEAVDGIPDRGGVLELEAHFGALPRGQFELRRRLVVDAHQKGATRFAKVLVAPRIHARSHTQGRHHRRDTEDDAQGLQHRTAEVLADLDETLTDELGRIHAATF